MTKKKLLLIATTVVYLFAMVTGYLYAKSHHADVEPVSTPLPQQDNWVFVRVDNMTLENPHLVSVWVMLSSFTSGPQVFFKPIYSVEWSNARSSELARKFSVNPDRTLNLQFLEELDRLNISRTGLVLLDNEGFEKFTTWFSTMPTNSQQNSRANPVAWHANSSGSEVVSYMHVCAVLQSQNIGHPIQLHWKDLVPDHFIPHPQLDPFAGLWDQLLSSSTPPNCKVLAVP